MFPKIGQEVVGLDIGGANLKAARWLSNSEIRSASIPLALWKTPERLAEGVQELLEQLGSKARGTGRFHSDSHLAVTMTGELADCFATRREGVVRIIDQLCRIAAPEQLSIYTVDGRWFNTEQAMNDAWSVAASNWHALATWLANWPVTSAVLVNAVLVDIGSTTVDILPLIGGKLATKARTDRDRLQQAQLVYTGIRRTPVCAVVDRVVIEDIVLPVMAELFATIDDAYLLLEQMPEDPSDTDTADGRPRTRQFAAARLARMIGEDAERLTTSQLQSLAQQVVEAQAARVAQAIECNLATVNSSAGDATIICSGHGLPLFRQAIRKLKVEYRTAYVNDYVTDDVARSAPAAAVAWLRCVPLT